MRTGKFLDYLYVYFIILGRMIEINRDSVCIRDYFEENVEVYLGKFN